MNSYKLMQSLTKGGAYIDLPGLDAQIDPASFLWWSNQKDWYAAESLKMSERNLVISLMSVAYREGRESGYRAKEKELENVLGFLRK